MNFYIYHHNDFDGLASAAIFAKFLTKLKHYDYLDIDFIAVDYDLKSDWSNFYLKNPCAILDFLYHQNADWWFDHHTNPYITEASIKNTYKRSPKKFWSVKFKSCPALMLSHFRRYNPSFSKYAGEAYSELLKWSDIIDGAQYNSPADYFGFDNIFMCIEKTISLYQEQDYYNDIINCFYHNNYQTLFDSKEYKELLKSAQILEQKSISSIKDLLEVDNHVAVYDQSDIGIPFNRYIAYHINPDLYYRIAIYYSKNMYNVSVNHNTWSKQENTVNIGKICALYGGGGRQDVGAITTKDSNIAREIAWSIFSKLSKTVSNQLPLNISY